MVFPSWLNLDAFRALKEFNLSLDQMEHMHLIITTNPLREDHDMQLKTNMHFTPDPLKELGSLPEKAVFTHDGRPYMRLSVNENLFVGLSRDRRSIASVGRVPCVNLRSGQLVALYHNTMVLPASSAELDISHAPHPRC